MWDGISSSFQLIDAVSLFELEDKEACEKLLQRGFLYTKLQHLEMVVMEYK